MSIYINFFLVFGYNGCRFIVGSRKKAVASLLVFEFKKIVCRLKVISSMLGYVVYPRFSS